MQQSRKHLLALVLGISSILVLGGTILIGAINLFASDQPRWTVWFWKSITFSGVLLGAILGILAIIVGRSTRFYSVVGETLGAFGAFLSLIIVLLMSMLFGLSPSWPPPPYYSEFYDAIESDLTNIASLAQQHYRRPVAMGGGNNAFDASKGGTAWWIPHQWDTTTNGYYIIRFISANQVVLVGIDERIEGEDPTYPNDNGLTGRIQVVCTVNPNSITSKIEN